MTKRHASTHPERYYARGVEPALSWKNPTWLERNGEFIVAVLGMVAIAIAAGGVAGAFVAGILS